MKETSLSRLSAGVGIIVIGVAALLGAFDIINFSEIFQNYWPLLLIAAGAIFWIDNPKQNYLWALILIFFGVTAQLDMLDNIDINFWQLFWPVVLIAIGWSILSQRSSRISPDATTNISALLSGTETKSNAKDYNGGKISAILGGVELDLSRASIKKEATIEVFALMGGIELRVPDDWEVRTSLMPILGGAENKTTTPKSKAPVLNIVGTVVLGGIEIKN